jgi:hypothetical protein
MNDDTATAARAGAQDVSTSNSLADLAARIRAEHEAVCASVRATVIHAFNAGAYLLAAKALIPHGHFGDWLGEHCDVAERTAQRYMQLARNRETLEAANPSLTADFTIDEAIRALARPKPPVEIEADYLTVPNLSFLPSIDGRCRIGILESGRCCQIFGVRADTKLPGFYQIAQMECYGNDDDPNGGSGSWCEPDRGRPVRGDGVRLVLEHMMRWPECFDQIEWADGPDRWPFPEPRPRPDWKVDRSNNTAAELVS